MSAHEKLAAALRKILADPDTTMKPIYREILMFYVNKETQK